jgi:plasmid stabilization system protein ParE
VAFQVLYTEPALADLEAVMARSWQRHPESTERFAAALLNHVDLLRELPFLGAAIHAFPGVRRLLHSPLHVYYAVHEEAQRVEVLHIWHARRQPPDALPAK